jgi:hypothetical protein
MSSLYKRATPEQFWMLRVIEGAIKNTCDAHNDKFSRTFAKSVAKRAVGTLTAERPKTLGAGLPRSDEAMAPFRARLRRVVLTAGRQHRGAVTSSNGRSPFKSLWATVAKQMRSIKDSGDSEVFEAYRDLLKALDRVEKLRNGEASE